MPRRPRAALLPTSRTVLDCGKYAGMTALEARKAILADLEACGALKETEPLTHDVAPATAATRSLSRWSPSSGSLRWSRWPSPPS